MAADHQARLATEALVGNIASAQPDIAQAFGDTEHFRVDIEPEFFVYLRPGGGLHFDRTRIHHAEMRECIVGSFLCQKYAGCGLARHQRSEERRVGEECVSTSRTWWCPDPLKQ